MTKTKPPQAARLLLIYNADSGIINALMHAVHKQVSPETYPCSLCAITYGAVSMHGEWRRFLDDLPMEVVIHHKDDFEAAYPGHSIPLPAIVLADRAGNLREVVPAAQLDATADTLELMSRVETNLAAENSQQAVHRTDAIMGA